MSLKYRKSFLRTILKEVAMVIADSCITSMAGADIIEAGVITITMTTGIVDEDAAALVATKMTIISDADIVDMMTTEVAANAVIVAIIEGVTDTIADIICIVIRLVNSHGNTNVSTVCRGNF